MPKHPDEMPSGERFKWVKTHYLVFGPNYNVIGEIWTRPKMGWIFEPRDDAQLYPRTLKWIHDFMINLPRK